MVVLVTGATGFLGREVVKALCGHGVEVRCLVHTPGREKVLAGQRVDVHYGSVGDQAALEAAFYDVDAVVHLVAVIRERGPETFQEMNWKATGNVVAAAKSAGVKHFVYMSAIGAADNPLFPYLYSKWQAEQAVINSGIAYTIVRASLLFGDGDGFINALAGLVRVFPVVPIVGSGRNTFQPMAVHDAARCVATSVWSDELSGMVIEVGGPEHLSYNDIVDVIARTYRRRRLKLHIPLVLMRPVVQIMEALVPRPPATAEQLRMVSLSNIAKLNTVDELFGFKPGPLRDNIEYIHRISLWDGLRIGLGFIPARIRDH